MLLDEPTGGLDGITATNVAEVSLALCDGRTTAIASHDLGLLDRMDKVVVLAGGRIVEMGSPADSKGPTRIRLFPHDQRASHLLTGPLYAIVVSFVRLRFGLYVVCVGMAGMLFYLLPLLPGPVLKLAFDGLASGRSQAVTAAAAALVLVEATRIISLCLSNLAVTNLSYRITNDVRQTVLGRLFASSDEAVSAARWLHRLSTDAEAVSRFVASTYGPVGQVFALGVAVAVLATVDYRMSVAAILPVTHRRHWGTGTRQVGAPHASKRTDRQRPGDCLAG